jgi:hypothetical protein
MAEKPLGNRYFGYNTVWMVQGKRLTRTGLNRYKSDGVGMPFEVEPGHLMMFSTIRCKI